MSHKPIAVRTAANILPLQGAIHGIKSDILPPLPNGHFIDRGVVYYLDMSSAITSSKPFIPGTTGWTAADLDDSEIERQWNRGRFEIVEGVLTSMAPAYFVGGNALFNLMFLLKQHLKQQDLRWELASEVDLVIDESRLAVADAILLTPEDRRRQQDAASSAARADVRRTRILIPPTLLMESISPGHEQHDRRIKRRWYAEFGVPNYWIIDAFAQSLECLVLDGHQYRLDQSGRQEGEVRPSLFPGLVIPLMEVWGPEPA